jgi:hypothetical protein
MSTDRRVEITGPVDRKMIINALNSARTSSWPISRTRIRRPGRTISKARSICAMPSPAHDRLHQSGRQEVRAGGEDGDVLLGAAARLASDREACAGGRQADVGSLFDFGLYLLPQREG